MDVRLLNRSDLATVMALKDQVGWNQAIRDWERLLQLNPTGCFACEIGDTVIGIVTTMKYKEAIGCIGSLLVDPLHRRQGIGTRLFKAAIERLEERGADTLRLITPLSGKAMAERMGFVAELEIERWVLHREEAPSPGPVRAPLPDFEKILAADREIFGADRGELLLSLHADAPDFTLASEIEGEVIGYSLGRGGSTADQLGPWVSWDQPTARELLDEFLRRSGRDTINVDCPKNNDMARELLLAKGFRISKTLIRMVRGPRTPLGRPELLCGILGPEFA